MVITALFVLTIVAGSILPNIVRDITKEDITIKVLNQSSISELPPISAINSNIHISASTSEEAELKKEVEQDEINGYLILKNQNAKQVTGEYISTNLSNVAVNDSLNAYIQSINQGLLIAAANLSATDLEQMAATDSALKLVNLNEANDLASSDHAFILIYGLIFLIYIFVLLYMNMIATEISKEKDSRILEVIISSTHPVEHFLGKLCAVIAVALTQLSVFLVGLLLTLSFSKADFIQNTVKEQLSLIPTSLYVYAGVFFLLALIGFSVVAALLGSLTSKVEEVGQYTMPLVMILLVAFVVAVLGISNPDLLIIKIMSYIPLISPVVMFVRVGLTSVPGWEIVASILIQCAFNGVVILATIYFYRGTVLTYSTKGSFIQSFKQAWGLAKYDAN
nr:ABC transporter permease [Listeria cornellensis]